MEVPLLIMATLLAGCAGEHATHGDGPRHLPAQNALGPYSGSVAADDIVFVSGKIGSAEARAGSFEDETTSAIDAVGAELARHGLTLADAVSVTVYLTDIQLYATFNGVYDSRFPEPYPARAVVGVSALPGGARVEISVTAFAGD